MIVLRFFSNCVCAVLLLAINKFRSHAGRLINLFSLRCLIQHTFLLELQQNNKNRKSVPTLLFLTNKNLENFVDDSSSFYERFLRLLEILWIFSAAAALLMVLYSIRTIDINQRVFDDQTLRNRNCVFYFLNGFRMKWNSMKPINIEINLIAKSFCAQMLIKISHCQQTR